MPWFSDYLAETHSLVGKQRGVLGFSRCFVLLEEVLLNFLSFKGRVHIC